MAELAPAARLVLACARVRLDVAGRERIEDSLRQGIDWDDVLALGLRHGLAPLVHRHLGSMDGVPKRVAATLWARAHAVASRNEAMLEELHRVGDALDGGGVRSIPFKGPLLTLGVYGDLALREFGDLDLLIAPGDVMRARQLLARLGYRPQHALASHLQESWIHCPRAYELALIDDKRGFFLELQWRANPGFGIPALDDRQWWDSVPRTHVGGREFRVLGPVDNALALLVHGSKHAWANLGWLVDIAELLRQGELDSQELVAAARASHAVRRVALGLTLAAELLDAPLPSPARTLVEEARIDDVAKTIANSVLAPSHAAPRMLAAQRLQLRLLDTNRQRAAQVATLAFSPGLGDLLERELPARLFFLYWWLRPARLARKYLFKSRHLQKRADATPRTPRPQPHSTN